MTAWQALGVAPDVAVSDLRRRYAALIKEFRPETHPQDFARIREAYEVVLTHARRREALAAENTGVEPAGFASAPVEEVPQVAVDPAPLAVDEDDAAAPVEAIAAPPVAQAQPEQDGEPVLAAHFRRFQAQAATAKGSDDEAHLPALRALLQARIQATLDDSQALEFALMRCFIEAESPPLTLLFETGRAFDWHRHVVRLSSWLSPWALRQMEARLALSRDLVYARHFSGNAWLRRLHAGQRGTRLLPVMRPAAVEATSWVERWRRLCEDADARPLAAGLDAATLRQLRGPSSTDLLVGLGLAAFAPTLASAAVSAIVAAAIVFGLRRLLQTIGDLPEAHRARVAARAIVSNKIATGVVTAVGAWLAALLLVAQPTPGEIAVAGGLLAPLALFATAFAWRVAAFLELVLAWPFLWREAVDRLEFDGLVRSTATPQAGRPFGARLGVGQRLQSIRAALSLQAVEIAMRERPPRARPFKLLRLARTNRGWSLWRVLWFGAWVLFAILRLVHAFGGSGS